MSTCAASRNGAPGARASGDAPRAWKSSAVALVSPSEPPPWFPCPSAVSAAPGAGGRAGGGRGCLVVHAVVAAHDEGGWAASRSLVAFELALQLGNERVHFALLARHGRGVHPPDVSRVVEPEQVQHHEVLQPAPRGPSAPAAPQGRARVDGGGGPSRRARARAGGGA